MVTPFGFSVGDFVAGIELIRQLINALEDSAGSSSEYRELIKELYSLERALLEVKHLDLDASQDAQLVALRQAATQCQQTIDEFLIKVRNFQPAFRTGGSKSSWRDSLRKIEWALYKKEDVERFRAQLNGHTASINMLMMTVQLLEEQQHVNDKQNDKIVLANQEIRTTRQILSTHTDLILDLTKSATHAATQEHTEDLKDLMLKILKANLQIYDIVLAMQGTMPHQIERQKPVLFLDACGRLSPIHLEFINSAEAFLAVLKVRFRDCGLRKIERKQFALEDTRTKRAIDLQWPWHQCLLPGQNIDMSMIFSSAETVGSTCPGCRYEGTVAGAYDVDPSCGMYYRRVHDLEEVESSSSEPSQSLAEPGMQNQSKRKLDAAFHQDWQDKLRAWEDQKTSYEDQIHMFRRVHINVRKAVHWSLKNKHQAITIGTYQDGSWGSVVSLDEERFRSAYRDAAAVHTNRPFDLSFCYFEIKIHALKVKIAKLHAPVGIGLCSSTQLCTLPGMIPDSWGYQSYGGLAFECIGSNMPRRTKCGSRWCIGDTIGCGWHPIQNHIWYTHNANYCGAAANNIASRPLFPTVAFSWEAKAGLITTNFGQHQFLFDLEQHWTRENPEHWDEECSSESNH